jgi:hypothetical protein
MANKNLPSSNSGIEQQGIARRRDEALRRALNTPPKQHKDMKKGKGKKQQDKPTTSQKQP